MNLMLLHFLLSIKRVHAVATCLENFTISYDCYSTFHTVIAGVPTILTPFLQNNEDSSKSMTNFVRLF